MSNIIFCSLMCKKDGIAPAILPLLSDRHIVLVTIDFIGMSLWFNHCPDGLDRSGGVVKIRIVSRLNHTFAPLCYYKKGMLIFFN